MIDDFDYPSEASRLITFQIGAVCVNWASIDEFLAKILAKSLNLKAEKWDVLVSEIDTSRKISLIKALEIESLNSDDFEKLENILNFIDSDIRPTRNRYVHDSYSFFTGENTKTTYKTKIIKPQSRMRSLHVKTVSEVKIEEIVEFNEDMKNCNMYLVGYLLGMIMKISDEKTDAHFAFDRVFKEYSDKALAVIAKYKSRNRDS